MDIKLKAYIFITCSLIGGALFPIAFKVADTSNVNIFAFIFLSYLIATIASFLLVIAKNKTHRLIEYVKKPREFIFIGLLGFMNLALIDYGLLYAEKFISASLATVVYRAQPLLMLIFIPLVLRERITKVQVIALALGFTGVYLALGGGGLAISSNFSTQIILLLVFMTLVASFATVYLKRYNTDMESTMVMFNSIITAIAFVLFIYTGAQLSAFSTSSLAALLYIGVVANTAVPFFYYNAFRTLKTTFVTNLYFLSPFMTMLFAGVLLQEPIYPYYLIIAILVTAGVFIQRFDKKSGEYIAKNRGVAENRLQIFDVSGAFIQNKSNLFYNCLKGGGRALAIKLNCDKKYESTLHAKIFEKRNCIAFTNIAPHRDSRPEEIGFINDIMGVGANDAVLVVLGDPKNIEDSFEEFTKTGPLNSSQ